MDKAGILSVSDSTLLVTLNVEQVREIFRQELLLALNGSAKSIVNNLTGNNELTSKEFLNVNETAELFRISASTVRDYIRKGKIKYQRMGRRIIIRRSDFESFISLHEQRLHVS